MTNDANKPGDGEAKPSIRDVLRDVDQAERAEADKKAAIDGGWLDEPDEEQPRIVRSSRPSRMINMDAAPASSASDISAEPGGESAWQDTATEAAGPVTAAVLEPVDQGSAEGQGVHGRGWRAGKAVHRADLAGYHSGWHAWSACRVWDYLRADKCQCALWFPHFMGWGRLVVCHAPWTQARHHGVWLGSPCRRAPPVLKSFV